MTSHCDPACSFCCFNYPPCIMAEGLDDDWAELKALARRNQEHIDALSQWVDTYQRPQPGPPGGTITCWRCKQPGHLARNCDGPRVSTRLQPSPSVPSRDGQPSPRHSPRRHASPRVGTQRSSGGSPLPVQSTLTLPGVILNCLCLCVCLCMLVLFNLFGSL